MYMPYVFTWHAHIHIPYTSLPHIDIDCSRILSVLRTVSLDLLRFMLAAIALARQQLTRREELEQDLRKAVSSFSS